MDSDPIKESRRLRDMAARAREGLGTVVNALTQERARAKQALRHVLEAIHVPPPRDPEGEAHDAEP